VKPTAMLAAWAGAQGLWLAEGYNLEFLGKNAFMGLWARGCAYVGLNTWVLGEIVRAYCV
jgi:phosphatidylinositol glycan class M